MKIIKKKSIFCFCNDVHIQLIQLSGSSRMDDLRRPKSGCMDISFHRFTSSFSNRCGFSASTRIRIRCVFKSFHSGDRFQKFAVTVYVFAGYVWTHNGDKMLADTNEFGYVWTGP